MLSLLKAVGLFLFISSNAFAESAYWDYGVGLGGLRFEHYPASNEMRTIGLVFPTFQYRGKILRADDRDGAHLYLFKGDRLTLEFSGQGTPALDSSSNQARKGMVDLPWMFAVGPQLVYRYSEDLVASFSIYQAITVSDFVLKPGGNIFETRLVYDWTRPIRSWKFFEAGSTTSKFIFSMKAGSKDLNALYFEVPPNVATADRPAYDAREGLINQSLSYYQSYHSGRGAMYLGTGLHSYVQSANRQSPLHKSDYNLTALIGFSYTLGESKKEGVPEEETSGVLERFRRNRDLRPE